MNKTIKFNGINRNTSITNNADGNCLEVFNLRAKGGRFEVVGTKSPDICSNGRYQRNENWCYNLAQTESDYGVNAKIIKYHQHKVGDSINNIFQVLRRGNKYYTDNIIGVWVKDVTSADCSTDNVVILWTKEISKNSLTLPNGLNIDIESVGNFLTFNLPAVTTFLYQDGEYKQTSEKTIENADSGMDIEFLDRFSANGPDFKFSRGKGNGVTFGNYAFGNQEGAISNFYNSHYPIPEEMMSHQNYDEDILPYHFCNIQFESTCNDELAEMLGGQYEAMQEETKNYREGFVFICAAYEMFDGTISNPTTPFMIHLGTQGIPQVFEDELGYKDTQKHYDIDTIDSFYNPDKIQITEWQADGTKGGNYGFDLKGRIRRQRQQNIIFKRPTMPTGLGKEYSKIVYFVSRPISMYDFSKLSIENLHVNMRADFAYWRTSNIGCYKFINGYSKNAPGVRFSLGNKMRVSTLPDSSYSKDPEYGYTLQESELQEGLPLHFPTEEEIKNIMLYKAVEFSIEDSNDIGELYYRTTTTTFYGKAVNFDNLVEGDFIEATTSSTETYEAEGLMMFNRRLHMYGIKSIFKNGISTNSLAPSNVKFSNLVRTGVEDYYDENPYRHPHAVYTDYTDIDNYNPIYTLITHAVYSVNINDIIYKYVDSLVNTTSPIITFPDTRLETVTVYWNEEDKYYKADIKPLSSSSINVAYADLLIFERQGMEDLYRDIDVIEITYEEYSQYAGKYGTWITNSDVNYKDRLKVSIQSNPTTWPVELDYQFDDDIVALGSNHKEISLAQEGQYPTYVFTKKGIWAMGLGTSAFYATQVPINPDVAVSRSTIGIGSGVVYVAKDGIKVLSGRQEQIISLPLDHLTTSDVRLLGNTSLNSAINQTKLNFMKRDCYNYGTPVASEAKELYNENCIIGFDRKNNELLFYLCNESDTYQTTQVFSLESKMWSEREEWWWSFYRDYGIRKDYWKYYRSSDGAALTGDIEGGVVNLTEETMNHEIKRYQTSPIYTPMEVCLITKPLSLGALDFKQIYHACLRGEIRLPNDPVLGTDYHNAIGPHFGFYVFGSNDGGDWKMVGGKCFQESVSQVVLERIKQSYRYVAFMLAGEVYSGDNSFNVTHIDLDGIEKYNTRQR